jgi:hypothetical protein
MPRDECQLCMLSSKPLGDRIFYFPIVGLLFHDLHSQDSRPVPVSVIAVQIRQKRGCLDYVAVEKMVRNRSERKQVPKSTISTKTGSRAVRQQSRRGD